MDFILFLALVYLFTFLVGILLERIKIPWIFAALIFGLLLAVFNPFTQVTSSPTFEFLAQLGMYFLLFLIGFEIDLERLLKKGKYITSSAFFIILLEGFFGSLVIHFIFGYSWFISALVAVSFATVGEAMLLPILDEFNLLKTDLGQTIIGIGTIDDIIEVTVVIIVSVFLGTSAVGHFNLGLALISLTVIFILALGLTKLKKESSRLKVLDIESLFLFVMFIFFLFVALGKYAEAAALGALLSGIAIKNFVPQERLDKIETDLKSLAYGLFGPLFFLWVGIEADINYLLASPLLILLVIAVANSSKLFGSWAAGRKRLGTKKSIVMGVGLSVRFSTSIVIIKLLYEAGIIQTGLYSVLIASTIIFMLLVPFLLSYLITRWDISESGK